MSERELPAAPNERECERCGRRDIWDGTDDHWRIARAGQFHCVHEWDINGTHSPFEPTP